MANEASISAVSYVDTLVPYHSSGHGWCDFSNFNNITNIVLAPQSNNQTSFEQEVIVEQPISSPEAKSVQKYNKRTPSGYLNYYCNDCGTSFSNSSNLKSHSRIHSGERPYICDICGASFVQSSNMKAHKRTHTGERPYECKECGLCFSRSSHLTGHMRTHTGERPYICGICHDSFVTSTHLRNHMRKHTGERPFICSVCETTFVQNSSLQIHLRVHTGERPYKCGICNSAFRAKGDLRGHCKLHTEDRPFICVRCHKPFKTGQYLKKHSRKCGAPPTGKKRGRPKKINAPASLSSVAPAKCSDSYQVLNVSRTRSKRFVIPVRKRIRDDKCHKSKADVVQFKYTQNKEHSEEVNHIDNVSKCNDERDKDDRYAIVDIKQQDGYVHTDSSQLNTISSVDIPNELCLRLQEEQTVTAYK